MFRICFSGCHFWKDEWACGGVRSPSAVNINYGPTRGGAEMRPGLGRIPSRNRAPKFDLLLVQFHAACLITTRLRHLTAVPKDAEGPVSVSLSSIHPSLSAHDARPQSDATGLGGLNETPRKRSTYSSVLGSGELGHACGTVTLVPTSQGSAAYCVYSKLALPMAHGAMAMR
ncbi:hypothetical protein N657DRAFT_296170 [Parathielavia appendiculata]|uniref:Uncharacterized protein n=1 Tax=Parathielavia appendiculata TaxID=2587402 RepID=A0AAN6Z6N0_9PEZI|nr:hypothetical protein N657DRAFT_296170 [Parathielavia appendiculata]